MHIPADDTEANLATAEMMGMTVIHALDEHETAARLRELLGLARRLPGDLLEVSRTPDNVGGLLDKLDEHTGNVWTSSPAPDGTLAWNPVQQAPALETSYVNSAASASGLRRR